jgi:hypothetical protein
VNGAGDDTRLNDEVLADEIALLGEVITAAAEVGRVMTQPEIDAALGLQLPWVATA